MIVIGIDPGFTGAIAWLQDGELAVFDMPTLPGAKGKTTLNYHGLITLLARPVGSEEPITVWLEQVGARPGQGVSSMFRFGQQLGAIEALVAAAGYRLRYVTPAKWKKHFGLSADKGAARGVAMQRFPEAADMFARAKDDGRAEAALIALYGHEEMTR